MDSKRKLRLELFVEQDGVCFWCHRECELSEPAIREPHKPEMFTVDHLVPQSRGGTDVWENVVGSCSKCNQLRSNIEQAILCEKQISGFGKRRDIEHLMPYMSVEEVLVEMKERIEPDQKMWPLNRRELALMGGGYVQSER